MSIVRTAIVLLFCDLLSSCYYTKDINIRIELDHSAVYTPDSSAIYFIALSEAWKKGKNIWFIMPIEGQTKYLKRDMLLYSYRFDEKNFTCIYDFGYLPYGLGNWEIVLVPLDGAVYMTIMPLGGWDSELRRYRIAELRDKLDREFIFVLDSTVQHNYDTIQISTENRKLVNLTYLYKLVKSEPYSTFRLHLHEIDPASEWDYIHTLTSLENTAEYRRMVIEQVVSKKSKRAIRRIYKKMQKTFEKLSESEKSKMERYTKEHFEVLERLMEE
ncbi:MAG TPA: hypothetical protein PKL52_04210 [Tenuifilaceae bacterium]|nr:hypothetical protein [Tenuifilaceae bacterium]